jgi:hypothetical protein
VTTTPGGAGRLQVTVAASGVGNTLRALAFGPATNAAVEASGQRGPGGFTATLPANTTTTRFTLSRTIAGQAATVPLTMTDACGDWPTVVGGGPSAF